MVVKNLPKMNFKTCSETIKTFNLQTATLILTKKINCQKKKNYNCLYFKVCSFLSVVILLKFNQNTNFKSKICI